MNSFLLQRQKWFGPLCLFAGASAFAIQAHFYFTRGLFSWKHAAGAFAVFLLGAVATYYLIEDWQRSKPAAKTAEDAGEKELSQEEFERRFDGLGEFPRDTEK